MAGTILLVGPVRPWLELKLRGGLACEWGLPLAWRDQGVHGDCSSKFLLQHLREGPAGNAPTSTARRLRRFCRVVFAGLVVLLLLPDGEGRGSDAPRNS